MSVWSVEELSEGSYGLALTDGKKSRTVYQTFTSKDAQNFLEMAEVYALVKKGAPVEAFKVEKPKAKSTRKNV